MKRYQRVGDVKPLLSMEEDGPLHRLDCQKWVPVIYFLDKYDSFATAIANYRCVIAIETMWAYGHCMDTKLLATLTTWLTAFPHAVPDDQRDDSPHVHADEPQEATVSSTAVGGGTTAPPGGVIGGYWGAQWRSKTYWSKNYFSCRKEIVRSEPDVYVIRRCE